MSESIINALMHLFAIIESVKDDTDVDSGNLVVEPYLKKHLNSSLASEYLNLFYDYLDFYRRSYQLLPQEREMEIASVNILQVSKICNQLNKELLQFERITVFIQLMELINADKKVSQKEEDFILLVAMNFNIPSKEVNDIKSFILDPEGTNIQKDKALLIDSRMTEWPDEIAAMMQKKNKNIEGITAFKHMYVQNLYGKILVLHIASINSFVFRYKGPLNLYIEGHKIYQDKFYTLKPGSIIKGPNIKPIYEIDISKKFLKDENSFNIVLTGTNVDFHFKNSSNGIQSFNFDEESGQIIGIMGGSGTGKSTLLNLLNGKMKPDSGQVQLNGFTIEEAVGHGVVGYVPQDDLLFEELTVYQNLYFNAKICFSDYSEDKIAETIDKVLNDLDLQEIRELKVGDPLNKSISGGQRKRLNIALELMREPTLLYVDEPTSGLSSMDSEKVMWLLKDLSRKGKLVIVIIHQPSSEIFKLFDKLWILDKEGYPIYNGNPIDAVVYFKTMSTQVNAAESECPNCGNVIPEQILQIIEAKEIDDNGRATNKRKVSPQRWNQWYREHIETKIVKHKYERELPPSNFHIPGLLTQFKIYAHRNFLTKISNRQYMIINLLEAPLLAFVLAFFSKYVTDQGYVFAENKNLPVYLFMGVVVALFLGMSVSAEEIFKDRKILARESFLNLSRFSYINSKIALLFALSAIQAAMFVIIGNIILEINGMMLYYWAVFFSVSCFANLVGLNISSALNSIISIYILIPFILVPQLLLGGAMINFDDLHKSLTTKRYVPIVGDTMASRWAYEALCVVQFKDNKFERIFYDVEMEISQSSYQNSFLIPRLEVTAEKAIKHLEQGKEIAAIDWALQLLYNETLKLGQKFTITPPPAVNDLNTERFTIAVGNDLLTYYKSIKEIVRAQYNAAILKKDSIYTAQVNSIGRDALLQMQREYSNKTIANLVTNRDELDKIQEIRGHLVQKKDPIYMLPESNFARSHFYAPVKVLFGWHIDTFYFNVLVIWVMTGLLYLLLWADYLRKFLKLFEFGSKKEKRVS